MFVPVLKRSGIGCASAAIFVVLFVGAFAWVFFVASQNPADSGESAILLLPFTMPWIFLVPDGWLGPLAGIACVGLNSFLVYLVFGGLRLRRR